MAEEQAFFQPLKKMEQFLSKSSCKFTLFRISASSFGIIVDKY